MSSMLERLAPGVAPKVNLAGDCGLLVVASLVATAAPDAAIRWEPGLTTAAVAIAAWLVGARALRQYDTWKAQGLPGDLALTSVLVLAVALITAVPSLLAPAHLPAVRVARFLLVLWPGALWLRSVIPGVRSAADVPVDVLVLGAGPLARHTAIQIREERSRRKVLGHLAFPGEPIDDRLHAPVLGTTDDLERVLGERAFDEVYIAGHALREGEAMQEAIHACERLGIPFALPASHFRFDRARPVNQKAIPDGYVHYLSIDYKPHQMALKRVFDVVAASLVLAALAPLFLVVATLIKLTSRGPIFFKQERVGRYGRPFHMLKFRSMVENAEALKAGLMARNEQSGPVFKIERDPRITAVGRVIRKYSIDELPQFINVLRGDMAIVGPRPPIASEVAKYEPWQRRRLSVPPGITCVWQVSGRSQRSFEEWMYLDMQYIDHWSLLKDLKLILKTLPAVLTGRGAS